MPAMRIDIRKVVLLALVAGCESSPAAPAYERCVNAEAEAKFQQAAEACREAVRLDPSGDVGKRAQAKLDAMAPHLSKGDPGTTPTARASSAPVPR
jgi:hypothetical protein